MSGWIELTCRSPVADPAPLLSAHLAPFLAAERAAGGLTAALLLRELGRPERPRLTVQARTGQAPRLADRWRRVTHDMGATGVTTGPAREVPLAGSGFDGPGLAPLTRDFLAEVTPALLPVAGATDPAARLAMALDLAAAHLPAVAASVVPGPHGGAPLSFLSFRSHSEAFLASTRDPAAVRLTLERRYGTVRDHVVGRLAGIVAQVRGTGPEVSPSARSWFDAVRRAKPVMAEAFRTGGMSVADDDPPASGGALARSAFHHTVGSSPDLRHFLAHDPGFLATRLLTSLLYLALHTTGLPLVERYFLCHALSRACEELFEVDADAVLGSLAGA
ncbi:MAG TPA: hypothetical protein VGD67_03120 [Pseudonocardiaceae bacterium]